MKEWYYILKKLQKDFATLLNEITIEKWLIFLQSCEVSNYSSYDKGVIRSGLNIMELPAPAFLPSNVFIYLDGEITAIISILP